MYNTTCNFTVLDFNFNKSYKTTDFDKLLANCSLDTNFDFAQRPSQPDKDTETAFKLIFYFLAAIENSLLLYVIYKDPLKRFSNTPSYFIGNFTIADLVSIISGICDSIFHLNPQKTQQIQEIVGCFAAIGIQSSFLIIMIFAIDRYIAIAHPYKYQNIMTNKFVLVILLSFPWCFSAIALPVIYFAPAYRHKRTLTNLFAGDVIALTAISIMVHPLTYWTFKRKTNNLSTSSCANKQIQKENLKIAKVLSNTVLLVSICLITFTSPYLVAFSFSLAECDQCFLSNAFQSFWKYYPLITAIRLMTNSFVYAWRLPLYRESLRALVASTCSQDFANCISNIPHHRALRIGRKSGHTISKSDASFEEITNTSNPTLTSSRQSEVQNELEMKNLGIRNEVEETCWDETF